MPGPDQLRRIHRAKVMNPVSSEQMDLYDPGYLVVRDGKIDRLSREDPRPEMPEAEYRDHGDRILMPGFIDAHVHLAQFGIMGKGKGELLPWLKNYAWPEEARFADPDYAEMMSRRFFDALIACGTTTAVIYCSIHEQATDIAFQIAREKGVRAFIGKVMMDRNAPPELLEDSNESIAASVRLFEKYDEGDGGRLRYVFTPRFAGSCSMELMKAVGRIAKERNAYVQTHLSENREEVEWIQSMFPDQPSYTHVYDHAGLLGKRSIMAHCIHVSDEEIRLLARTKTQIAFCPCSNQTLRSGTMPYRKMVRAKLNIGLGSDVAGGPTLSILDQVKLAETIEGTTRPALLYNATLGGAKGLGIEMRTGSLVPGKDADFTVLDNDAVVETWICGRKAAQTAR